MKARLICTLPAGPSATPDIVTFDNGEAFVLQGTVIDHPDAHVLVAMGFATAEDDECKEAVAKVPPSTIGIAKQVHDRIMTEYNEALEEVLEGETDDEGDDE